MKPRRTSVTPPGVEERPAIPGLPVALIAAIVFGVAMLASQFPYGQYIAPGLAVFGILIGFFGLGGEGRAKLVAIAAASLNLVTIGLVFLAPSWLGLDSWRNPVAEIPKTPQAVGHGTGAIAPAEWVNASNSSWAEGDVRIAVRSVTVAPVELVGPNGTTRTPKEPVLQISLRLSNEGVERRVELVGWAAGGEGASLTDSSGTVLLRKRFESGWAPKSSDKPTGLYPGKSVDVLLVYECPPGLLPKSKTARPEFLRLELPGVALGLPDPARFHIPGTSVLSGKIP